ncbi:MAG TPA: hypothetical protein ENN66_01735 [Proteobacteria bacterium]|mgnify:CR=1 FL=1|nr:hypothetical protein [Pseudomonadota bacterium]
MAVGQMLFRGRKQIADMGKGKRLKQLRKMSQQSFSDIASVVFTRQVQKEIHNSTLWDQIAAQFGEKRALEILSEGKVEINTNIRSPSAMLCIQRSQSVFRRPMEVPARVNTAPPAGTGSPLGDIHSWNLLPYSPFAQK